MYNLHNKVKRMIRNLTGLTFIHKANKELYLLEKMVIEDSILHLYMVNNSQTDIYLFDDFVRTFDCQEKDKEIINNTRILRV